VNSELINHRGSVAVNLATEQLRLFMAWQQAAVDERCLVRAETAPHVTLLQDAAPDIDLDAVRAAVRGQGATSATTSEFVVFKSHIPGVDILAMRINSDSLLQMHKKLENAFGDDSEKAFAPHMTLALVKEGTHDFLNGLNTESRELLFDEVRVRNNDTQDDDTFPLNYEEAEDDD
jgi:2'-5' RNA ligase